MGKEKKRIEAIAELFYSEKSYIADLKVWQVGLRKKIMGLNRISLKTKYEICDSVFINMRMIYDFHRKLFKEMHEKNKEVLKRYPEVYAAIEEKERQRGEARRARADERRGERGSASQSTTAEESTSSFKITEMLQRSAGSTIQSQYQDSGVVLSMESSEMDDWEFEIAKDGSMDTSTLEYASIFLKHFDGFSEYEEYVARLPKSEYEFDKSMHKNERFNTVITTFLQKYNIDQIGTKNFFYRPSSKMARYPLLLRAIAKNETDTGLHALYQRLMDKFKVTTMRIDRIFKVGSDFFIVYLLSGLLKFQKSIRNKLFLGLIFIDIKLIKEGKLIVKSGISTPVSYKQVYIFNKYIIFCQTVEDLFGPIQIEESPIFLNRLTVIRKPFALFERDEKLNTYFPIYLVQGGENIKKVLYFEDENTRNLYFTIICTAIHKIHKKLSKAPSLVQKATLSEERLFCVCSTLGDRLSLEDVMTSLDLSARRSRKRRRRARRRRAGKEGGDAGERSRENTSSSRSSGSRNTGGLDPLLRNKPEFYSNAFSQEEESSPSSFSSKSWKDVLHKDGRNSAFVHQNFPINESQQEDNFLLGTHIRPLMGNRRENSSEDSATALRSTGKICKDLFKRTTFYFANIDFEKPRGGESAEYREDQRRMLVYSTSRGIYKKVHERLTLVSTRQTKKIIYDTRKELLFYLSESTLYISRFNSRSTELDDKKLNLHVNEFFYGYVEDKAFLALTSNRDFGFSLIYLLNVISNESVNTVVMCRKLYVGFDVSCIAFMKKRMVIACKDFEIMDVDTLRTQDLLESYDPITSTLIKLIKGFIAKKIYRIEEETYLLCFDGIGFYIDPMGCYKYTHITFNWECIAHSFRIYLKDIIVLCKTHMSVFSLETGRLVYYKDVPNLRFVENTNEPLMFDNDMMYRYYSGEDDGRPLDAEARGGEAQERGEEGREDDGVDIDYILGTTSTSSDVLGIIKYVESQRRDTLELDFRGKRTRVVRDAHSDDVCVQHYSLRPSRRRRKYRRGAVDSDESPAVHAPGRMYMKYINSGTERYSRTVKYKNSIALNKVSYKRSAAAGLRVNMNSGPRCRVNGLYTSYFTSVNIAEKIAGCRVSVEEGAGRTPSPSENEVSEALPISDICDSVSTMEIIDEYESIEHELALGS